MCAQPCLTLCNPMEFSRQEYWSGWPLPSPGDLPNPGIKPVSPVSPALQVDSLYHLSHQGSPNLRINWSKVQARYILFWSPDTVSPLNPQVWHPWFQLAVCGLSSMGYQTNEYRGSAVFELHMILKIIHARPFSTIEETDTCGHEVMSLMVCC